MTTIATKSGIVACDSRVTGCFIGTAQKIYKTDDAIVGYCGDWIAGDYLTQIYLSGAEYDPDRDVDRDDDIDIMVVKRNGQILLLDNWLRSVKVPGKQYAIGSGSQAAMVAMNMGATAAEAIKEAMRVDPYTGGRVRTYSHD